MPAVARRYLLAVLLSLCSLPAVAAEPLLELKPNDHVAFIGNTLADRMQHDGWLETYIQALHPELNLTFRNLGFPADEITVRNRSANFGSPDEWLTKVQADVVFCFFGYNEALKGEEALGTFRSDLAKMIDDMRAQKYNGESAPQLVVFSPIAHEDVKSPHLPDGTENNRKLALYTEAMRQVCAEKDVPFVDLFAATSSLYGRADKSLTMNGIHLQPHGNRAVAEVIVDALFDGADIEKPEAELERLREAVLDKNYHWFSRYRVVDGYNVYGGRSKLAWFGQSNADVMMREMEIFDVKTANRDKRVWAVARGGDLEVKDDNLPEELEVRTNKPGPLEGGRFAYLDDEDAIDQMQIHEGMQVNVFASEEMFPRLINPVQMAVDTDSRLWVSVWPSYPHWNPTEPRRDAILILPDEDLDGVADECIVFADELNSITGFEFWGGGVLVAAPPEIWFLKDTDGDDRADVKIRMLQGVSSADTHHSANAMLIGPDGWLYWSRGIFNVANFETPTKTYRSGRTGVHRFNPRTFEVEFHFPIGPNPHGDVFDQWGYQFASDGTSGTGSYINIGKGVGNKQWYQKRVRPVPAIGILSSSHFPERFNGNFLICNAIGFLGVLQHEVKYNGADITAEEIDPILVSSDQNFRPSDLEVGGDGALYVADWHNVLIGHMQHNMRDPNRDHEHGRIYRVTYKGRELLTPPKMKGKPIAEVCDNFLAAENGTRYRARLELSGRDTDDVVREVGAWAAERDVTDPVDAQALLECLWVHEEHRVPNGKLLHRVFQAEEPRVRAAAIRTLGHWGEAVDGAPVLLVKAARDESALVRAEAIKAALSFDDLLAAEIWYEVADRPLDPELDYVLNYARGQIDVDAVIADTVGRGEPLTEAAKQYVLRHAGIGSLRKLGESVEVYEAILSRPELPVDVLRESVNGLSRLKGQSARELLLATIVARDRSGDTTTLAGLGELLAEQPAAELQKVRRQIESLATSGETPDARQIAYRAWMRADGSGENALFAASKSKESLRDFLASIRSVDDAEVRSQLYDSVRSLVFELPPNLEAETGGGELQQPGIHVDFFHPSAKNVAVETLAAMTPKASGVVPRIEMNVPQKLEDDAFALRFTGQLHVPEEGRYTFFIASDDGSRIYVDDKLVVNNDGLHGMVEKQGRVRLSAGAHRLVVTYFDNGGGDGLRVAWSGPGFNKQPIPEDRLTTESSETLHDVAIRTLASIPGHGGEKFRDLAAIMKTGKHRAAAVSVLRTIPEADWNEAQVRPLIDNLVGYLTSMPASLRTSGPATEAIALARSLATKLPADQSQDVLNRLENLDVRVIAIGTVTSRMIFDKEQIAVQAGTTVEFRFSNTDHMPHNFAIVVPGALEEIGELAEATGRDADAKDRHYIPRSDKVLLGSRLLETGQNQALTFEVPTTPGVYPYVCTYPGHWRRMHGALYVVEDLNAYEQDPEGYLASHPLSIKDELLTFLSRNTEWTFDDLAPAVAELKHGRSYDVGRSLFTTANCVACHKIGDQGRNVGPDLAKLDPKKRTTEHILRSLVDPSKDIDDKYRSSTFLLDSGQVVTGMVVEENDDVVKVLVDPLAKADPRVIETSEIDDRTRSDISIMPKGLLNKLTQEEILDLIAYVYAAGDRKHMIFGEHHHH
ncbi:PVC-type heme-binding CxxCH protein [Maioricimonas sp. JC845]|uniref:PVC-type heme-binding CxxCH protein n=1 Tax=Maioricimonas sp. JC845 TaxID=3232138 RepID=UPI00345A909C